MNRADVTKLILDQIDEYNEGMEAEDKISKKLDAQIYGSDSSLDSMGLVSFIVGVEEKIENIYNTPIALADEKAMSQKNSPYSSINALTDFILKILHN